MARFEIPGGWAAQAYRFALDPTPTQVEELLSHAGGARFAYNVMLAAVKSNLEQRAAERSYGIDEADLTPCRALAEALSNWGGSRNRGRGGPPMGFPRFKSKARAVKKFSFTTGVIRVEPDRRHVSLPRLGTIRTHESTRKLARRIEAGTARILKATVRLERGRWQVSLTCLVAREVGRPAHVKPGAAVVGVDAGVKDLIVVADPEGNEVARHRAPGELKAAQRTLRAVQRKAARQVGPWEPTAKSKRPPSRGWQRTQADIGPVHARVAHLRADRLHKLSTALGQAHDVIGVESLAVKNMMAAGGARKRGLNRAFGDAGLGQLRRQLDYKTGWCGARTVKAGRWFPSSKLCSGCGVAKAKLHLAERTFVCDSCGLVIDRDLNAAVNLARHAQRETDPSTGVVTGGADPKTSPHGEAGGSETRTRTVVGDHAHDGGSASPKGEAA
jgi:putative transposase